MTLLMTSHADVATKVLAEAQRTFKDDDFVIEVEPEAGVFNVVCTSVTEDNHKAFRAVGQGMQLFADAMGMD